MTTIIEFLEKWDNTCANECRRVQLGNNMQLELALARHRLVVEMMIDCIRGNDNDGKEGL